ncbi:hypothetical protein [Leptobacterium sp. I13]|uniref:hypothetical protein n=1 Tax=Leptobacterium meishanense TaxID=3128904 RepID=UPI0030EB4DF5
MFNFFKKKPVTLSEYLQMLVRNPNIKFQIDIYRDNQVDFQITRQRLLKKLNVEVADPKGFGFLLTFNFEKDNNEKNFERFKNSDLYNKSIEIELLGRTFVIRCKNDVEEVTTILNKIQTQVYNYNDDTIYRFAYTRHGNGSN